MIFWIILAALTICALAFVAWPFLSRSRNGRTGNDLAVYRDQLDEIERDRSAGLIEADEAEAARVEVSRRLIKAAETERGETAPVSPTAGSRYRAAALVAAVVVIPALSAGLYYKLGAPAAINPKSAAIAAKKTGSADSVEDMIAKVEAHLERNPEDARSWEVLAPVYMRFGRYDDAVEAWKNVIRLQGESAERLENLGESQVAAANGVVTADAKASFDKALSLDKDAVAARYYTGLAAVQDGRRDDAARIWRELLASAPPDASWAPSVKGSLDRLEGKAPPLPERPTAQAGEPSQKQMQDAANLPQDQQDEMIRGMIEKLAARLKMNGDDPQGWARLVRSYAVIGDQARAESAAADARKALSASPVKLAMFEESIKELQSDAPAAPAPAQRPASDAGPQSDMIKNMVAKLADKLKQNGDDPEGWLRLVRSYGVLGEQEQANQAIASARSALSKDADKLRQFEVGLKTLEQ